MGKIKQGELIRIPESGGGITIYNRVVRRGLSETLKIKIIEGGSYVRHLTEQRSTRSAEALRKQPVWFKNIPEAMELQESKGSVRTITQVRHDDSGGHGCRGGQKQRIRNII